MVQINNPDVIKNLIKAAKIQLEEVGKVPNQLAEKIIAVLNINTAPEKLVKFKSVTISDSTSLLIHTTHATRDTYLVGFQLSVSKDAVSDSTYTTINIIPFGEVSTSLIRFNYEPITAGEFNEFKTFEFPIKLEKNTHIFVVNHTATASIDTAALIMFYEVEDDS
jgi:hypothetical protein